MQEDMVTAIDALPHHALTVADWMALPEDSGRRWELTEGSLIVSARPVPAHSFALTRVLVALDDAAPAHAAVLSEVDVDLRLQPAGRPATVRVPDIVVVTADGYRRTRLGDSLLQAHEVVLAVEFVSPSSRRTDRIVKYAEYADAGIEHYWIVDLDDGPSLTACRLVDGGYEQTTYTGVAELVEPFAVAVDLGTLV